MTDDEREIRELIVDWRAAAEDGDVDRMAQHLGAETTFLVPGQAAISAETYIEGSRKLAAGFDLEVSGEIVELVVSGSLAACHQLLNVRFTPKGGGPATELSGPSLLVFKRRVDADGSSARWQLWRDANLVGPQKKSQEA